MSPLGGTAHTFLGYPRDLLSNRNMEGVVSLTILALVFSEEHTELSALLLPEQLQNSRPAIMMSDSARWDWLSTLGVKPGPKLLEYLDKCAVHLWIHSTDREEVRGTLTCFVLKLN